MLVATSLLQVSSGIAATGLWPGAVFGLVTVLFAAMIAHGNRARFLPMLDNRCKQ